MSLWTYSLLYWEVRNELNFFLSRFSHLILICIVLFYYYYYYYCFDRTLALKLWPASKRISTVGPIAWTCAGSVWVFDSLVAESKCSVRSLTCARCWTRPSWHCDHGNRYYAYNQRRLVHKQSPHRADWFALSLFTRERRLSESTLEVVALMSHDWWGWCAATWKLFILCSKATLCWTKIATPHWHLCQCTFVVLSC